MKILSIVGARPQFIKLAPLSALLADQHEEIIVHTGQHYDYLMSEKIFKDLGIREPDYHLGAGSGSHASQTGNMMKGLEEVMLKTRPDKVIVFGDTNSTLAGALAAAKLNIHLVHIEAGLRSYNKSMPEEINRVVTDHVSSDLFAPTKNAMQILEKEGLKEISFLTGDIMVDTLANNLRIAEERSDILSELKLVPGEYNLLTLHRGYNVDDPEKLFSILPQLESLEEKILFPVHPRTNKILESSNYQPRNIELINPVGYLDFILLEKNCKRIITDSGGIQKEAYILKKPCITLRTETEWVETVEEGWNLLLDPNEKYLADRINEFKVPKNIKEVFGQDVAVEMVKLI
ncbi:MAG: UDP-N-acetylglucosamine 2-epimerase (non-hydrolyzing) [Bacteroidales bacterium]|nr:UDP-N-acetylglucosamine 2-epimerase (non-hydrolyzing) [Bacteroidales bacterium]